MFPSGTSSVFYARVIDRRLTTAAALAAFFFVPAASVSATARVAADSNNRDTTALCSNRRRVTPAFMLLCFSDLPSRLGWAAFVNIFVFRWHRPPVRAGLLPLDKSEVVWTSSL